MTQINNMCGIFGIIGKNRTETIERSLDCISHRGPDDMGEFQDENVHIGFRRLSIVDLSIQGHQPMGNEDATVWIVFNGEIYNYKEIKSQLSSTHTWKSQTDTEVLIHGYEEWGMDELLKKLNGMFAFCLYDKKRKKTFLVRDRIGKKPLYYYSHEKNVYFSSETKAFFKLKHFEFTIDSDMFKLWLGFPYLPESQRTIIHNVFKVPPASYLSISANGKVETKKYWRLPTKELSVDIKTSQEELENLLIDSVNRRLEADVPVGILLSGGLDSSLVTAIAAKYSKTKIRTINISFNRSTINESKYAQIVADHCKTNHMNLSLKLSDIYSDFKKNIAIYDDLSTSDCGLYSEFLLAKQIRKKGIKVVLVGEGADEIFAGYSWYQLSQFPFRILPFRLKTWMYYYAIMRYLPSAHFAHYSAYLFSGLKLLAQNFFRALQRYEITRSLPNHYCMKVDKATSAASIEARSPYMDYRIVEYASQIPQEHLLHSKLYQPSRPNEKYILRKIAEKYLPKSITRRKKKGGMLPLYDFLNLGLKEDSMLILNNQHLTTFFGKTYLSNLISSKPNSKLLIWQREWILWKCLIFSLWYEHYNKLQ